MKVLDDLELSKRQARTQEGPATLAPKISKDQLQVDWTAQTATELDRLHRAWSDHVRGALESGNYYFRLILGRSRSPLCGLSWKDVECSCRD